MMMDRTYLAHALVCGVVLVDDTSIPTGNRAATRKGNFNGKHRMQTLNVQVAAWPDGTLVDVSAPVPADDTTPRRSAWRAGPTRSHTPAGTTRTWRS